MSRDTTLSATATYDYPHYLVGTRRRAFIDDGLPALSPLAQEALRDIDGLKDLLYARYPVSPRTAKLFDSVNCLRRIVAQPHPLAEHLRHYQAELDAAAVAWRKATPELYSAYETARTAILTFSCAVQREEANRQQKPLPAEMPG